MRLRDLLTRIKSDIKAGENFDAYIAFILVFVFVVLGIFGNLSTSSLNNLVLLALGFLVVISLKNRYVLQDAQRYLVSAPSADASQALLDRSDYTPLDERLTGASEVFVIGNHLLGFVSYYKDRIRAYASGGCLFKFIVIDPKHRQFPQSARSDAQRSIQTLQDIADEYPGKIVIRVTTRKVPCAIFAVDVETVRGLIQVQPHPLFRDSELRPHYDLRAPIASRWYSYYKGQITLLWEDSADFVGTSSAGLA